MPTTTRCPFEGVTVGGESVDVNRGVAYVACKSTGWKGVYSLQVAGRRVEGGYGEAHLEDANEFVSLNQWWR